MGLVILLKVFVLQIIVASIIIFVLKRTLDNMLIDLAMRHFDLWLQRHQAHGKHGCEIILISHKPLKTIYKEKILKIIARHSSERLEPVFQLDKSILGGLIIKGDAEILDFSLKVRLKEAFSSM